MRACSKCGSVKIHLRKVDKWWACKRCGFEGPISHFPHLHTQGTSFKDHATTGPGSHRVNPPGNKHS